MCERQRDVAKSSFYLCGHSSKNRLECRTWYRGTLTIGLCVRGRSWRQVTEVHSIIRVKHAKLLYPGVLYLVKEPNVIQKLRISLRSPSCK